MVFLWICKIGAEFKLEGCTTFLPPPRCIHGSPLFPSIFCAQAVAIMFCPSHGACSQSYLPPGDVLCPSCLLSVMVMGFWVHPVGNHCRRGVSHWLVGALILQGVIMQSCPLSVWVLIQSLSSSLVKSHWDPCPYCVQYSCSLSLSVLVVILVWFLLLNTPSLVIPSLYWCKWRVGG